MGRLSIAIALEILLMVQASATAQNTATVYDGPNYNGNGTLTVTRKEPNPNAIVTSETVQRATRDVLAYFLITRANKPLETLDGNIPVYQALDKFVTDVVPRAPVSVSAGPTPAIKSHRLGESWQQFLSKSPFMLKEANQCAVTKRPEPKPHPKKILYNPCQDFWAMTDNPSGTSLDLDCQMEGTKGVGKDTICQDFDGEVVFEKNQLVSMKRIVLDDWNEVYPDMTAKFGMPAASDGASAVWSTPEYKAAAFGIDGRSVALVFVTTQHSELLLEQERETHINALD